VKILDFGFFVQIQDSSSRARKEGLVHVSQIRNSRQRLERAQDAGFEPNDLVWVKLTQIREDGKLSFSMKECEQETGADLNPEKTEQYKTGNEKVELIDTGAIDYKGETIKVPKPKTTKLVGGITVNFEEAQAKGIGAITGIPLESKESKFGTNRKQIDPDMLWLKTRLEGGGILGMVDEPGI